jgi:carbon starvation protein
MSLLAVLAGAGVLLTVAYLSYGRLLAHLLRLDPTAETPAVALRDDSDFVPIEPRFLLSQHFSAIAAAGPIVGPITAGVMFGWLPALVWILVGSILIGGVHDFTALVASVRHRARSIAEVVREHMSGRAFLLFLAFVWLSLVYIIVAFTDVTAGTFGGGVEIGEGRSIPGAGIATSSILYLLLALAMGVILKKNLLSLGTATVIFLPLVGLAILGGPMLPFDLGSTLGLSPLNARRAWNLILLGYCFAASIMPMWLLLQPRGHLGGYFLYLALAGGALGLALGGETARYPAIIPIEERAGNTPVLPLLCIMIACGACSGFHSIIASGTTSKQLRRETDARVIGYGTMLLEAMVAIVSLACVMRLAKGDPAVTGVVQPDKLYALGIGGFLAKLGIPASFGVAFALMAFSTFVYDTLDVCIRLGRYILTELFGWKTTLGQWVATALTTLVPAWFLMLPPPLVGGEEQPIWKTYWTLFGASNQLLAALTLLGVTVWLWRTRRAWWVWPVVGVPTVWMYGVSMLALFGMGGPLWSSLRNRLTGGAAEWPSTPVPWVATVLMLLGGLLLVEALIAFLPKPPATRALGDGREPLAPPRLAGASG